jgi:hypothetical protein
MLEIINETILDTIKLLPFLFITFLFMEYMEHKLSDKSKEKIEKSGRFGPIIGSILGIFPQCGFSVAATNLYSARVISIGTLIAIYLATSDEMLPIFLSEQVSISFIILVLFIKLIVGIIFGLLIDLFLFKNKQEHIHELCEEEHCDCEHGILKSTIKHTISIFIFLFIIVFLLNITMYYLGEDILGKLFMKNNIFGSFITSLIGLIPNCAASVIVTELYLNNAITFGSMIAGLLTNSGLAILVLFKTNKNKLENLLILSTVYSIGVIIGIIFDLFLVLI